MIKKHNALTPRLDDQLCFAVYSTFLAISKAYRPLLSKLGVTYSQYLVLLVLWEKDGQTVSEIGEQLFLDSATLTPLLKRMEVNGLLERNRATHDERHVIIQLTSSGNQLRDKAEAVFEAMVCNLECPSQELVDMKDRLSRLRNTLLKKIT